MREGAGAILGAMDARFMPKLISAGFATCALASASVPAISWNVLGWNDDFARAAETSEPALAATVTDTACIAIPERSRLLRR